MKKYSFIPENEKEFNLIIKEWKKLWYNQKWEWKLSFEKIKWRDYEKIIACEDWDIQYCPQWRDYRHNVYPLYIIWKKY